MNRRKMIVATLASCLFAASAAAQYPSRPVKMIVPFAAGGSTDLIARVVAEQLRKEIGQPVIIENRGGAAGAIGTEEVAKSTPDGYTLAVATVSSMVVYPASKEKPNYTLASFVPITNMASMPNVMTAGPSIPAKSLTEFIALAKANPGKYSYASSGVGSINHMLGESFQAYAGVKMVHIPYKGSGPAMQDVMGGQVDVLFDQFPSSKNYIDGGKLKGLGAISPRKIPGYPNVMTMEEAGMKGFTDEAWYGVLAPAKTPPDVIAKLTAALQKALSNPELRARIEQLGARPVGNTSAEFTAQIKAEVDRTRKLIKDRSIKLDE